MRDVDQIYRLLSGRQIDAGDEMVKVEDAVAAVKRWFPGREEMTTLDAVKVAGATGGGRAVPKMREDKGKGSRHRDGSGSNRQRAGTLSLGNYPSRFIRIRDASLVV